MFTGIVIEMGTLKQRRSLPGGGAAVTVSCQAIIPDLSLGASVCVAGVCTTVTELGPGEFGVDLSPETLRRTTLGDLTAGARVNLEPSLRADQALGGHLVAGHVDGIGWLTRWDRSGQSILAEWEAPHETARFLVEKGSVAVDGVSLTPYQVRGRRFSVSLIPETLARTTLGTLRVGAKVNIEADLLAKYAQKALPGTDGVTLDLLRRAGFLD